MKGSKPLRNLWNETLDQLATLAPKPLASKALEKWSYARSALYFAEGLPILPLFKLGSRQVFANPPKEYLAAVKTETQNLYREDAQLFTEGLLPFSAYVPPTAKDHLESLGLIWSDLPKVMWRRWNKRNKDISRETVQKASSQKVGVESPASRAKNTLPEYYVRNFHFQTDGYLSEQSATIYDHQVEILFRGTANAMRRLLIRPFAKWMAKQSKESPLRVLELGAGTGSFSQYLLAANPEIQMTLQDLSSPYLELAKKRLHHFSDRLSFETSNASELPHADKSFDAVVSVFLFHEVPAPERLRILQESKRVLKPGGFFGMIDSIQKGDNPDLDWGIDQFPKDFHEPFYKHYAEHELEPLIELAFGGVPNVKLGFYSKMLSVSP